MTTIKYIQHDGQELEVDVADGNSVMQGAMDNMVEGVVAECGGACSCATCHVFVDEAWIETVGEACDVEKEMLAAVPGMRHTSRLSCQIEVEPELNGLIVRVPAEQV